MHCDAVADLEFSPFFRRSLLKGSKPCSKRRSSERRPTPVPFAYPLYLSRVSVLCLSQLLEKLDQCLLILWAQRAEPTDDLTRIAAIRFRRRTVIRRTNYILRRWPV
jgi:hypothetical protein